MAPQLIINFDVIEKDGMELRLVWKFVNVPSKQHRQYIMHPAQSEGNAPETIQWIEINENILNE